MHATPQQHQIGYRVTGTATPGRTRSIRLTLELLSKNRITLQPLITHRSDCGQIPDIYARFDAGDPELIGAVFDWNTN